jgi:hypothetical protein
MPGLAGIGMPKERRAGSFSSSGMRARVAGALPTAVDALPFLSSTPDEHSSMLQRLVAAAFAAVGTVAAAAMVVIA